MPIYHSFGRRTIHPPQLLRFPLNRLHDFTSGKTSSSKCHVQTAFLFCRSFTSTTTTIRAPLLLLPKPKQPSNTLLRLLSYHLSNLQLRLMSLDDHWTVVFVDLLSRIFSSYCLQNCHVVSRKLMDTPRKAHISFHQDVRQRTSSRHRHCHSRLSKASHWCYVWRHLQEKILNMSLAQDHSIEV